MVRSIENLAEFNAALSEAGDKLVVIDFTAVWCGPCKMIAPFFASLSEKYTDVVFLKVDVDDAAEFTLLHVEGFSSSLDVSAQCEIKCMPTFQFYKNSKRIHEFSGANQASLEQKVLELK
ncbi:thioredoxin-like isoform 1-T1 [Leptodactylus fuscus]|uniref:thioredoxin-like isoform X1 n=1 Tax=Leptodactylus fuscus TaxID=238119 RepID=UPI003F4EC375